MRISLCSSLLLLYWPSSITCWVNPSLYLICPCAHAHHTELVCPLCYSSKFPASSSDPITPLGGYWVLSLLITLYINQEWCRIGSIGPHNYLWPHAHVSSVTGWTINVPPSLLGTSRLCRLCAFLTILEAVLLYWIIPIHISLTV